MANSIDSIASSQISAEQTKASGAAAKTDKDVDSANNQATSARPDSSDQVVLTDSAKQLQAIEQQLKSVSAVDSNRVESIKQKIASGEFQVDAEKVAEKLMVTDELLG